MKKSNAAKRRKQPARKTKETKAQPHVKVAREYVDDQLALLNRLGTPLRISKADYDSVINKVASISSFGQKKDRQARHLEDI